MSLRDLNDDYNECLIENTGVILCSLKQRGNILVQLDAIKPSGVIPFSVLQLTSAEFSMRIFTIL